jgi:hypothetical protein
MKTIEVEALTEPHNYAVIRLPTRRFPGVVVQGDTLSTLVATLRRAVNLIEAGATEDGLEEVGEVLETLEAAQGGYEAALEAHAIPKPY